MRKFKFVVSTLSAFLLCSLSYGQANVSAEITESWLLVKSINQVDFYAKVDYCDFNGSGKASPFAMIKILNNSGESRNIQFNFGMQYEEGCDGCVSPSEYKREISLSPGENIVGDCTFKNGELARLINNVNLKGGWIFQNIQLSNIIVD